MFNKLKDFWEEVMIAYEKAMWNSSEERKVLAITRIEKLKSFTSGESKFNPYAEFYEKGQ